MKKFAAALFALLLLAALPLAWAWFSLRQPVLQLTTEVDVEIPRGSSTLAIGKLLESKGLLRSPLESAAYRLFHPRARYQAGEYVFRKEDNSAAVLAKIARGEVFYQEITIPEGYSLFEIADLLERQGHMSRQAFLSAAQNPSLIRDLAPEAPSLEGYLFPSRYRFPRKVTPRLFCERLTTQFRAVARELGLPSADLHRLVTLASLVEKESAVPTERPLIAGVYTNRLRLGMKLECDPTVIYAAQLSNHWRGTIYRSDLDRLHPYNTYRQNGLPPGAIANPGREALLAALRPATTEAIFFVAEPGGSGKHVFSRTLSDHNRAVAAYRNPPNNTSKAKKP